MKTLKSFRRWTGHLCMSDNMALKDTTGHNDRYRKTAQRSLFSSFYGSLIEKVRIGHK